LKKGAQLEMRNAGGRLSIFLGLIIVDLLFWRNAAVCQEAQVIAPPQATSAGRGRLIFNENFANFHIRPDGVTYTGDNGVVWANNIGFYNPSPANLIAWNEPGVLTLSSGQGSAGVLNTHLRNWPRGNERGSTLFHFGYFEASMRLAGAHPPPDNWASFWLFSAEHQEVAKNPAEWSEIDIFESGFYPAYSAVVHDWHFNGQAYESPQQVPGYSGWHRLSQDIDLTQWHTYGALWEPGKISYYLDDKLVQTSVTNKINDMQPCSIILSVNGNNKSQAQFRWVHVFN
jgi:hypothetical protein